MCTHFNCTKNFLCWFQEPLNFPASELRKFFKVGDHVKVIHGKYEGDTGLVLRVLGKTAILFSDLTMHEVCCGVQSTFPTFETRCQIKKIGLSNGRT